MSKFKLTFSNSEARTQFFCYILFIKALQFSHKLVLQKMYL